jgi:hypothetical protein
LKDYKDGLIFLYLITKKTVRQLNEIEIKLVSDSVVNVKDFLSLHNHYKKVLNFINKNPSVLLKKEILFSISDYKKHLEYLEEAGKIISKSRIKHGIPCDLEEKTKEEKKEFAKEFKYRRHLI